MCGGIRFNYDPALEPELAEVFTPAQIAQARTSGTIQAVFWQPHPVLPALVEGHMRLFDWGNRDEALKLPRTGWVRMESLEAGKWNYLHPLEVLIPAFQGVEKKVWFGIDHGIRGYLVRRDGIERIYMLTVPPTPEYRTLTSHDRMPALIDQDRIVPINDTGAHQNALGL